MLERSCDSILIHISIEIYSDNIFDKFTLNTGNVHPYHTELHINLSNITLLGLFLYLNLVFYFM